MKIFLPVIISSTISLASIAQQRLSCGNGPINESALNAALEFERSGRTEVVNYFVRVYFHVFHDNNGTGGAATLTQINSEFTSLLASYAADNICFLNAGIDSINSTALNRSFNADSDPNGAALSTYQVAGCINIFYMQVINGNNTACNPPCGYGGIALGGIPGTFFLVSTGNIGSANSIGHEMGHSLGLYHTFETAFGFERIDGNNSSTAADKITDTPADPFAYNGTPCYSTNPAGCTYTGTCTDPNMQTNFSPPYTNLMSYWGCVANPVASAGQFTRANSMLTTFAGLMNCTSPGTFTQTAITVSSGFYMKSAISSFATSGNVVINSGAIAAMGGQTVILSPGFIASPTGNGHTFIRPRLCN